MYVSRISCTILQLGSFGRERSWYIVLNPWMDVSVVSCVWARLHHVLFVLFELRHTPTNVTPGEAATATPVRAACFRRETVSTHTETHKRHFAHVVYSMALPVYTSDTRRWESILLYTIHLVAVEWAIVSSWTLRSSVAMRGILDPASFVPLASPPEYLTWWQT